MEWGIADTVAFVLICTLYVILIPTSFLLKRSMEESLDRKSAHSRAIREMERRARRDPTVPEHVHYHEALLEQGYWHPSYHAPADRVTPQNEAEAKQTVRAMRYGTEAWRR